ncbi:MAG: hypothetical protein IIT71_03180, partial [Acetobacter sp.]|nr:hypothetical protein [Acetobacter sp.]
MEQIYTRRKTARQYFYIRQNRRWKKQPHYVFGQEVAKVGEGKPVTQETKAYSSPKYPLTIYDSKGLELEEFEKI